MTSPTPKTPPPLSLLEKVALFSRLIFLAPPQIAFNITRCVSLAAVRGIPLGFYVDCGFIRFALGTLSPRQLQYMQPSTASTYRKWIASRSGKPNVTVEDGTRDAAASYLDDRLKFDVESLPDGASTILWVGDRRKATKFVYFFHGGGYVAPMMPEHLEWCLRAYVLAAAELKRQGKVTDEEEVAVAVLQYTLCPGAQYPVQLCQAAAGLEHLIASGVKPGDLIIGGDSAGGNLTCQLLSHLLHPHPASKPIHLSEPLAGAFTVSPWISVCADTPSMKQNGSIDMLSGSMMKSASNHLLGGVGSYDAEQKQGQGWAMAADVDFSWFDGLREVTCALYVTVGAQEVLRDQGIAFAEAVRVRNPGVAVHLEISKHEAHDFILLEGKRLLNDKGGGDGDALKRMRTWVSSVFWSP